MAIKDYIQTEKNYIIDLRRYFHAHPEPSLQEFETCKKIEEELDKLGIPHQRIGDTGIYGWIDGKKGRGKIIGLRSDIDALSMEDLKDVPYRSQNKGVCHACGHDAHTATLLGAAKVLKAKENEFAGQVRLFFQQAEEIGQGGRQFVASGVVQNIDRVFSVHVSSGIDKGKIALSKGPRSAACDYFKITVHGKGAHVAQPHNSIDALYIASQIVVNLQSIVSRSTSPLESVVVGIGVLKAGSQYNIVAEQAELEGTTRTFTPHIREFTNKRVTEIAQNIAALYGAQAEVEFKNFANPLINNDEAVDEVTQIAKTLIDEDSIFTNTPKSLGADDYADFLAVAPGMYAYVGTRNPANPNTAQAHHHGLFDIDEEALLLSCNLYVDYALWVLNN